MSTPKAVGLMLVKDEADLLPEVLEHLDGKLDALYAYDDGSVDDTNKILRESSVVTYLISKEEDKGRLNIKRPMHHTLLEKIKEDYAGEEVWVFITEADRFFLNKMPRQIVEEAEAGGYARVAAIQLDFVRHNIDPWTEENDTFPNYGQSIRNICKWFKWDEHCVIAFKLSEDRSYLKATFPWPKGGDSKIQYEVVNGEWVPNLEVPFLEHQGRRGPKGLLWKLVSGSRPLSVKYDLQEFSFDGVVKTWSRWYDTEEAFPWVNVDSLKVFLNGLHDYKPITEVHIREDL